MTTLVMIRHASFEGLGISIVGRKPGVHLNQEGVTQAHNLARRLSSLRCEQIYSSPMERAQETASALAQELGMNYQINEGLNEIDYGEWTGKTFDDLNSLPAWRQYNTCRETAQIPGGESMPDFRQRAQRTVAQLSRLHPGLVILVSHADCIRAIGAHCTGASLDTFQKFETLPASVNVTRVEEWGSKVLRWNDTGQILAGL